MQLTLEHIETEMQTTELSPDTLADFRVYLAALYSFRAKRLQDILSRKPRVWLAYRDMEGVKSAKEADHLWDATEDGQQEIQLRWELRRIERLSSAIASKLRIMEVEIRNLA